MISTTKTYKVIIFGNDLHTKNLGTYFASVLIKNNTSILDVKDGNPSSNSPLSIKRNGVTCTIGFSTIFELTDEDFKKRF